MVNIVAKGDSDGLRTNLPACELASQPFDLVISRQANHVRDNGYEERSFRPAEAAVS